MRQYKKWNIQMSNTPTALFFYPQQTPPEGWLYLIYRPLRIIVIEENMLSQLLATPLEHFARLFLQMLRGTNIPVKLIISPGW